MSTLADTKSEPPAKTTAAGAPVYRRILVGLDFSDGSSTVFEQALKLAKQNRAELVLAHVFSPSKTMGMLPPDAYEECYMDSRNHVWNQVRRLAFQTHTNGVRCHGVVLSGLPENALAEAARKLRVDLLVIGTKGRHGVAGLLMGSVAWRVIARAGCPVLTVK